MSNPEQDPVVGRAIDELRKLPPVNPAAVGRIVAAAAVARVTPADEEIRLHPPRRTMRTWGVAGVAAAAAVAGFAASTAWRDRQRTTPASVSAQPATLRAVTNSAAEAIPIVQQFVFNNATAHRVSVVGDFNRWNASALPMHRASDGELWSVSIPLAPGRHIYGFMVDDSVFVLDPRAATAHDPDLGTDGSVVIVGRP